MALQPKFRKICSFCLRNIAERRHVKGSIRLKHSGSSVTEVVEHIMGQDIPIVILCFRCYRLILGIDYHQHEFKRLKDSFLKIYRERCIAVPKFKNPDFSRTVIEHSPSLAADRNRVNIGASELSSSSSHTGMNQDALSGYQLQDPNAVLPAEIVIPRMSSDTNHQVEEIRSNQEGNPLNLGETDFDDQKSSREESESNTVSRSSKRRKILKKLEDYEYYMDYSKDLNEIDRSKHCGNFVNVNESKLNNTEKYCALCQKDFVSRKDYCNHPCIQIVIRDSSFRCKSCQMAFSVRQQYIKHINSCYKNVPVKCHLCMVELQSAAYLPRHLAAFHNGSTVTHKSSLCDECGRVFSRKEALQRHQAKVHGVSHGTYQCSKCGQTFPHTSLLMEHMRAHKGYPCSECKKMFTCMSNLTLHKQTFHQNKKSFFCSTCNKRWRFHASYTNHMRKIHGTGQFKCLKCKLLFSAENAFDKHKAVCEGVFKKTKIFSGSKPIYEEKFNLKTCSQIKGKKNSMNNSEKFTENCVFSSKVHSTIMQSKMNENDYKNTHNDFLHTEKAVELQSSGLPQISTLSEGISCVTKKSDNILKEPVTSTSTENYQDSHCVTKAGDEVILMPETDQLEESQLLCQDSSLSSSEIVLETLDDLSSDCQYVILVEDGSSEQK